MYKIIPSEKRYFSDLGSMNSYFLLSFADYYDPKNESFGNLRVFNDDCLMSGSGFPLHPHKYYEIMTIVLKGAVTHQDNLGNHIVVEKNQIQVTNTSHGIFHSEFNEHHEKLELFQLWFAPPSFAPEPIYYTDTFQDQNFENTLYSLASGIESSKNILSSQLTVKRGKFEMGKNLEVNFSKYVFLYVIEGKIQINNKDILKRRDQLRTYDEKLEIQFLESSEILVIESL